MTDRIYNCISKFKDFKCPELKIKDSKGNMYSKRDDLNGSDFMEVSMRYFDYKKKPKNKHPEEGDIIEMMFYKDKKNGEFHTYEVLESVKGIRSKPKFVDGNLVQNKETSSENFGLILVKKIS